MDAGKRKHDVVVIGGGHNGLTAAALLAKSGRDVVLVEKHTELGGLCVGGEFHPGYSAPGVLHDTATVRPAVADVLRLQEHGLEFDAAPADVFAPQREGRGLLLSYHPDRAADEIASHSARDADRYGEYRAFIAKIRKVIEPVLNEKPPNMGDPSTSEMLGLAQKGLAARRLGSTHMMELLRVPSMCVADWLREWFESELLNATLALPAILGTWAGPWSPGTASNLLMWECTAHRSVAGGAPALVAALERSARAFGVDIRTGAAVESIKIVAGAAAGVVLADEEIEATTVVSSCDPRTTFLDLLGAGTISHKFEDRLHAYRMRGTTAKVNLALRKPLEFACRPGLKVEYARTGEDLDSQERAFDAVKYRRYPERPLLDIHVSDSAPDGHSVASILVHFASFELDGGWTDEQRARLGESVLSELSSFAPDVRDAIVAQEVLTPMDIARRYGVHGGHVHHGEHALDQLVVRPTLESARYATPISGLYLCGSGAFPGGGVTCAPGALAARVILER